jgi:hypothetical protein
MVQEKTRRSELEDGGLLTLSPEVGPVRSRRTGGSLSEERGNQPVGKAKRGPDERIWKSLNRRCPWLKARLSQQDTQPTGRTLKWVAAMVDTFAVTYGPVWLYVIRKENPDKHVRAARRGVVRLARWVSLKEESSLKRVKRITSWWRRMAVKDHAYGTKRPSDVPTLTNCFRGVLALNQFTPAERRRRLFQLSRWRRAGPFPTSQAKALSLHQHQKDLTGSPKVSKKLVKSLRRFVQIWANGRVNSFRFAFPFSSSATEVTGVKEGGLANEVKEAVASLKDRDLTLKLMSDIHYVVGWSKWRPFHEGLALRIANEPAGMRPRKVGDLLFPIHAKVVQEGLEDLMERRVLLYSYVAMALRSLSLLRRNRARNKDIPGGRQHVVEERGEKSRVITPITGCVTYMAKITNSLLTQLLDTDPRLDTRVQDPSGAMDGARVLPFDVIRSVDMSRATDLIPHPLQRAMCEGLKDSVCWTPFLKEFLSLSVGPYRIRTPDGSVFRTSVGSLMGCGTSWPLLNLYNLWLWETAWTRSGFRSKRNENLRRRVRLVGDDLLGIAPGKVSEIYTSLLVETNGQPSQGKDMESKEGGVLCEEFLLREEGRLKKLPTVPVTCLSLDGRTKGASTTLPTWARGPEVAEQVVKSPLDLRGLTSTWYKKEFQMLRKAGIGPTVPRSLGGGGFPTPDVEHSVRSLRPKWARAIRCLMSQGLRSINLYSRLQRTWSYHTGGALSRKEKASIEMAAVIQCKLGPRRQYSPVELSPEQPMSFSEMTTLAIALRGAIRGLEEKGKRGRRTLRLKGVTKRLERALDDANSLVPYPKLTDTPRALLDGWVGFIEQMDMPLEPSQVLSTCRLTVSNMVGR